MGTNATLKSNAFGKAMRSIRGDIKVYGNPCPLLVHLVENGMVEPDNEITTLAVKMYLEPLMKENIDTLILGCTHYPLLYEIFNRVLDYKVTLIDSGSCVARYVRNYLMTNCILAASRLYPEVLGYAVFAHQGNEAGHKLLLDWLNTRPLLNLGLRLGEGSGAVCAYPIVDSAVRMLNEMDSFDQAAITKYF